MGICDSSSFNILMDTSTLFSSLGGVIMALGGWEAVKWLLNRKSNSRIAEANAEKAELENEKTEFHFLRERLEFKDKELMEKEQRFVEQTNLVRDLNRQLLEQTIENGKLQARISALEAERSMKLCERRGCVDRQPQSGY